MKSDKINSTNFHGDEEQRLASLLAALPQVGAPSDFEFRVKARIATRKDERSWARRVPASLRLAMPLLLFFLTGVAAIFYFTRTDAVQPGEAAQPTVPTVAAETPFQQTPNVNSSAQTVPALPEVAAGTESNAAASDTGKTALPGTRTEAAARERRPAGGSVDMSLDRGEVVSATDPSPRSRNGMAADQMLLQMGAKTVFENDGYRVLVVEDSSIAKNAGIEKDDVVQMIGKQKITRRTSVRNLRAEDITVLRKGEVKTIPLRPATPVAPQQQKN